MNTVPRKNFRFGTIDSIEDRALPEGAASRSLNWITKGTKTELRRGQALLGATDNQGSGEITGLAVAEKANGTQIPFRTRGRKIEYYDAATDDWIEIGTNTLPAAADGEDVAFSPYTSLAGNQLFASSPNSSIYKIMVANPGSITDLLSTTYRGRIAIKLSSTYLWGRIVSGVKYTTILYRSYLDKDEIGDYTQISAEALASGDGTTKTFTGTLAFKAAGSKRTCFGVQITDGTETFTDDKNGALSGSAGGTGTINYTTGAYSVTFNAAPAVGVNNITGTYYWEDSTSQGIADFTYSNPRTAGQGNFFLQNDGGDIQNIATLENVEYAMHQYKTYALTTSQTDTAFTNLLFRDRVGIPNWRAAAETGDGIYYIDDTDENDPHFRLLTFAGISEKVVPRSISKAFKIGGTNAGLDLSDYRFDAAAAIEWGDYILFACRHKDSTINNRVFVYDKKLGSVDMLDYRVSCFAIYDGTLIAGDSGSNNVYKLFSGFDDDDSLITNYWEGPSEKLAARLTKSRKLVLIGDIGPDQKIKVSVSIDHAAFVEVGSTDSGSTHTYAIEGSGSYVDKSQRVNVGSLTLGRGEVGGGSDGATAYHYEREFNLGMDVFEEIKIRFEAVGIGYCSVSEYRWQDVRIKGGKAPKKYR